MTKVVIVGASGLVGAALVERFVRAGSDVVAVSRREPETDVSGSFEHAAVDLTDADRSRAALAKVRGVTHVVYAALYEQPGLISGWTDPAQMRVNDLMFRNAVDVLAERGDLQHVTALQGGKAYGLHIHPIPVPARERHPRDPHDNFYWLQEDHLTSLAEEHGFRWTIMRPSAIIGPSYGAAMSVLPVVGAYAALCAAEGRPFGFPGHVSYPRQFVDVRLIAHAIEWAMVEPRAWSEHFNLTNGEVSSWETLWPHIADALDVPVGPRTPMSMVEYLPSRAALWQEICQRRGLRPTPMSSLLGESHHLADQQFGYGLTEPPWPGLLSTIKIKQAGFTETCDTEASVRHWLEVLVERRIIPGR